MSVLLGDGDGTFDGPKIFRTPGQVATSIALADVNLDNRPDLLVANLCAQPLDCSDEGSAVVFLSTSGFRTFTNLSSGLNPSIYGQAVSFIATARSTGPNAPVGTVTFKNGTAWLGNVTLNGGVATLTTSGLPTGTLSITARYNGDPDSVKSTSATLIQQVNPASSTTTIKSSVNPSVGGQLVTFTATVSSTTAIPRGTITFKANGEVLGTVALVGQKASIATSAFSHGGSWITALYNGTSNFLGSKASLTQTVK